MNARFFLMALAVIASLQIMFWIGVTVLRQFPLEEAEAVIPPQRSASILPAAQEGDSPALAWGDRVFDALSLPAGEERNRRALELFLQWVGERPAEALTWGEEILEGQIRDQGLAEGLAIWARNNPTAAARWIEGMTDEPSKANLLRGLLRQWGANDGLAAAMWLDRLGSTPQVRAAAAAELAQTWARQHPRDALEWSLLEYNKTGQGAAFAAAFAGGTVGGNLEVTRDFIDQLPAGEARVFAVGKFAGAWTETEPLAAFRWAVTLPAADESSAALASVMDAWARAEPSKAADALNYIEEPYARADATAALMERWVASDAVAASAWLDRQPAGEVKDGAIQRFTAAMFPHDPAMAITWAQAIQSEPSRVETLVNIGGAWLDSDPQKAQAWLSASQLPEELVQSILVMHQMKTGSLQSVNITDVNGNPVEQVWTPEAN